MRKRLNRKFYFGFTIVLMLFIVMAFSLKSTEALNITTFTNRAAWESAVSDIYQEDFNTYTNFTRIAKYPDHLQLGVDIKCQEISNNTFSRNAIEPENDYSYDFDGTSYIKGLVKKESIDGNEHNTRLNVQFENPIMAWGADFVSANNGAGIDFWLTGNDNYFDGSLLSGDLMNNDGFFGFVIDEATEDICSVIMQAKGKMLGTTALTAESFGMDNLRFVRRRRERSATNSVPEPGTIFLFGSLLIGLGVFKKNSDKNN